MKVLFGLAEMHHDWQCCNFLCLRGFAPMSVLQDISKADENIQRKFREILQIEVESYNYIPEMQEK